MHSNRRLLEILNKEIYIFYMQFIPNKIFRLIIGKYVDKPSYIKQIIYKNYST